MLPYTRAASFFESRPVLEQTDWVDGLTVSSETIDVADFLPAMRISNVAAGPTTQYHLFGEGSRADPRYVIDYYCAFGVFTPTVAASTPRATFWMQGMTSNQPGFTVQTVVPLHGREPVIQWPTGGIPSQGTEEKGTIRVRSRAFRLILTMEGSSLPLTWNFGAYLRVV